MSKICQLEQKHIHSDHHSPPFKNNPTFLFNLGKALTSWKNSRLLKNHDFPSTLNLFKKLLVAHLSLNFKYPYINVYLANFENLLLSVYYLGTCFFLSPSTVIAIKQYINNEPSG